jgi:hypothetical protein
MFSSRKSEFVTARRADAVVDVVGHILTTPALEVAALNQTFAEFAAAVALAGMANRDVRYGLPNANQGQFIQLVLPITCQINIIHLWASYLL